MTLRSLSLHVVLTASLAATLGCNREQSDSIRVSNLAMDELGRGKTKEARAHFKEALALHGDNAAARYGLALCEIEDRRLDKAKEQLAIATRLKPEFAEAHYHLGWIGHEEGKLDVAESALRRVVEIAPEHADAHLLLGRVHDRKGALKDADQEYRRAITLAPSRAEGFVRLAQLYVRVGADREALEVLEEARRVLAAVQSPNLTAQAQLENERGVLLLEAGRYREAESALLEALKLDGSQSEAAFNLGCAYASQGQSEPALRYFRQYLASARDGEPATLAREVTKHLDERIRRRASDPTKATGG